MDAYLSIVFSLTVRHFFKTSTQCQMQVDAFSQLLILDV